jgi:hemerythrin-like domain-containing protein
VNPPSKDKVDPIAKLAEEHGLILSLMDAFERCAKCFEIGTAEVEDLLRFGIFFREFGELIHHEKEESIAFAALGHHGFLAERGPRADLHDQHVKEVSLLSRITHQITAQPPFTDVMRQRIVTLVVSFCALQREHMRAENQHFYPALKKLLTVEESRAMANELRAFDEKLNRNGRIDWLLELAETLEGKYSGPEPSP